MIAAKRSFHVAQHDEVDAEGSWAVSYGDMITLLLTFFIVFFTVDPESAKKVNKDLNISLVENLTLKSSVVKESSTADTISVGDKAEDGIDPKIIKKWNGLVHDKGHHIIIEFPYISFFGSAQTELTKAGRKALADFSNVYIPYAGNYMISIRAYADKRQIIPKKNARFKDNLELTALRSVSTMRVLQESGIPLSRLRVGGYGELVMTAEELSSLPPEHRAKNADLDLARKVVLVIEPEERR